MPSTPYSTYPLEALPVVAAALLEEITQHAVKTRGEAHIALSGGTTPRALFRLLATPAWQERLPWAHIHLWWADERCVPPDHPDSNYGAVNALLLQHLSVMHIHRMHGEHPDPAAAARAYETELRQAFRLGPRGRPRFDLVLLGMGADGHTASLFPGAPALEEMKALVDVGQAPEPPYQRLTLTLPVLNRSAFVLFLVTGVNKGSALAQVFHPHPRQIPLPAGRVRPTQGQILWLLDHAAAVALS